MTIIQATNRVAIFSLIAIVYLFFTAVIIATFGLKIFGKSSDYLFGASILGFFLLLFGSIVVNVMFNLTSMAESQAGLYSTIEKPINISKKAIFGGAFLFLIIFSGAYAVNEANEKKREAYLIYAANSLLDNYAPVFERTANYSYSLKYLDELKRDLELLLSIEERFPYAVVLVPDMVDGHRVILQVGRDSHSYEDEKTKGRILFSKRSMIFSTSQQERDYLFSVFDGSRSEHKYSSNGDKFELYLPVVNNKNIVVLYLSKHSRYAKR